jgi:HSP20 family protein
MFDDFFMDDGWDSFFDNAPAMRNRISVPRVDIEDKKDHYEVVADFPGFTKDQIHVSYEHGVLTLEAHKDNSKETNDKDKNFIRKERYASDFRRQFAVKGIKKNGIKAALHDGVLTITLPKAEPEIDKGPTHIAIE